MNRRDVVKNIHSGSLSSLVYGYSGTAEIEYLVNDEELKIVINDKGSSKLYIDGVELITSIFEEENVKKLAKVFKTEPDLEVINRIFSWFSENPSNPFMD
ncbi:MAG: hypothetical protein ACXQTS_07280 [Candidatus Methanospirareceae archaeon]